MQSDVRELSWTRDSGEVAHFSYKLNNEWYYWPCNIESRRAILSHVSRCAGNPSLSLSYDDAAEITARIRQVVGLDSASPQAEAIKPENSGAWLVIAITWGVIFWAGVVKLIIWTIG